MTAPPALRPGPAAAATDELAAAGHLRRWSTRAMATSVVVQAPAGGAIGDAEAARALAVASDVERTCSRFVATSPLAEANTSPDRWHRLPGRCVVALREARRAYLDTGGRFDPRVHDALVGLGYDRTLPFADGVDVGPRTVPGPRRGPWRPRFVPAAGLVHLGGSRVDLGGIGKGLAVRWMAERLRRSGPDFLVDAGGDCYAGGRPAPGEGWAIGVEDPGGGATPLAVLSVHDRAVVTSSTRIRAWRAGGRPVHHLIDPRTGRPAAGDLVAVTVVGDDAARAEVWAKALFLSGRAGIRAEAERRRLAALWIGADRQVGWTSGLEPFLSWTSW